MLPKQGLPSAAAIVFLCLPPIGILNHHYSECIRFFKHNYFHRYVMGIFPQVEKIQRKS
jgi:hypothetical protein